MPSIIKAPRGESQRIKDAFTCAGLSVEETRKDNEFDELISKLVDAGCYVSELEYKQEDVARLFNILQKTECIEECKIDDGRPSNLMQVTDLLVSKGGLRPRK